MYEYHTILPLELLNGDERTNLETLSIFLERMQEVWRQARVQMEKLIAIQESYYGKKHQDILFAIRDLVLLNTHNLRFKGIPHVLQQKFAGPYKILE